MSKQITVKTTNTEEELKSFPLNQSIKLVFSSELEDSQLTSCIALIRNLSETGVFNISEKYNQSIGYVREKFDIENTNISSEVIDGETHVTISPTQPLHPGFDYTLFVDSKLSSEFLSVDKIVSKSNSKVSLETTTPTQVFYNIKITSNPSLTATTNTIKCLITNKYSSKEQEKTLNLKKSRKIKLDDYNTLVFESEVYVKDEEFNVSSQPAIRLNENFFLRIRTSLDKDVQPIKTQDSFQSVTNEDILNFYKNKRPATTTSATVTDAPKNTEAKVIGKNKILITLGDGITVHDIDIGGISFTHSHAFHMYMLEDYQLYDPNKLYTLETDVKSDKELLITIKEVV